jgi:DNA-binding NarL/FixJ family response regulator
MGGHGRQLGDLAVYRFCLDSDDYAILTVSISTSNGEPEKTALETLTQSERAIYQLLIAGLSNLAIACARGASVRTVANQNTAIFKKLGVGSRRELRAWHERGERAGGYDRRP